MVSLAEQSPVNARQMGCEPPRNTAEAKLLAHIIAARGGGRHILADRHIMILWWVEFPLNRY